MSTIPLAVCSQQPGRYFEITTTNGKMYGITAYFRSTFKVTSTSDGWSERIARIVTLDTLPLRPGYIYQGQPMCLAFRTGLAVYNDLVITAPVANIIEKRKPMTAALADLKQSA